ncbi:anti-phage deoxyguanosine triphosphatase [soil metagenome]
MENRFYSRFDTETTSPRSGGSDYRTPFQIDRDRIIHTSAFRRLQSKTQVFLSGQYDFYRTRLTHSIEVAQIGRSICASLKAGSDHLADDYFIDSDLVEAACLAHDIGHPPFGHTGERTLNRLMADHGGFEGNAQTLRMLTETIFSGTSDGMAPTRALADAVLKYKSLRADLGPHPENHFLYDYQHGVLAFVFDGQHLPPDLTPGPRRDSFRSIECQIMDWADDTAYSINDLQDGIRAGFITLERLERWAGHQSLNSAESAHVDKILDAIRAGIVERRYGKKIGAFIAACHLEEHPTFMGATTNRYRYRLGVDPALRAESDLYKRIALDLVFRSQQLAQLDFKADFLLTQLFGALAERYFASPPRSNFRLLPEPQESKIAAANTPSERARLVCDALAEMTDAFAMRTSKRLFDADHGSIIDLV